MNNRRNWRDERDDMRRLVKHMAFSRFLRAQTLEVGGETYAYIAKSGASGNELVIDVQAPNPLTAATHRVFVITVKESRIYRGM